VPAETEVRTQVGKPGSYKFESVEPELSRETVEIIQGINERAYETYKYMISRGVAKELARAVLPVSMYTQFYWTVNARSLMNFLGLRTHETAQYDIRQYAEGVAEIFAAQMPVTYASWEANGRATP
jgi:thymidylate synthase (FAD)